MRALVTGAAGFIGSTLCAELRRQGHEVRGVDCLTPYYDSRAKEANVASLLTDPGFELARLDLRTADPIPLLRGTDVVFHLAGQPGVRLSWADGFAAYTEHNVLVTQRLLEAARAMGVERFVYASSSSVYGNAASYPTHEDDLPLPHSPYGVTKLAAEHLCGLYAHNWGVPTTSLRYFTVYGPRQRPDMAIHRIIEAGLSRTPFSLFGTGDAVRDFTYVGDVVSATILAGTTPAPPGTVLNVAGGSSVTMNELLALVADGVGTELLIDRAPDQPGDVQRTGGSTARAAEVLGWAPRTGLPEGIAAQVAWHRRRRQHAGERVPRVRHVAVATHRSGSRPSAMLDSAR